MQFILEAENITKSRPVFNNKKTHPHTYTLEHILSQTEACLFFIKFCESYKFSYVIKRLICSYQSLNHITEFVWYQYILMNLKTPWVRILPLKVCICLSQLQLHLYLDNINIHIYFFICLFVSTKNKVCWSNSQLFCSNQLPVTVTHTWGNPPRQVYVRLLFLRFYTIIRCLFHFSTWHMVCKFHQSHSFHGGEVRNERNSWSWALLFSSITYPQWTKDATLHPFQFLINTNSTTLWASL